MFAIVRSHWLAVLATAGFVAGLVVDAAAQPDAAHTPVIATERTLPTRPPYAEFVAGTGLVESAERDVLVAAPVTALVERVHVAVGEHVAAGAPLLTLDRRITAADRATRDAAVGAARAQRAERRAALADARARLQLVEAIEDARARSTEELLARRGEVALAEARLAAADADLQVREGEAAQARVADEERVVRAPRAGEILAVAVRPGEVASAGGEAAVRMGRTDRLHVRVDIDENDAWRVVPGARARLYLRGNAALQADLRFEHVEPYVRPKLSLSGAATERVDTRVLQLVYSLPAATLPLWIGQQVDVVVEAPARPVAGR